MEKSLFDQMGGIYKQVGDYLLSEKESKEDITYIADLVLQAKETDCNVVSLLKQHITIEEVRV